MIVVVIIGILAAIAIPQYQNYVARAQVAEALSLTGGTKIALAEYFNTNGVFPDDNTKIGLKADGTDISGKYVTSVLVTAGAGDLAKTTGILTALFAAGAHKSIAGGTMTLTGTAKGGSISWACASTGTPVITTYLPSTCQ